VLLNVLVILVVAVVFNYAFRWRRYPAWLAYDEHVPVTAGSARSPIEHADLVAALGQIDSYIDVSEEDLLRIYELATGQAVMRHLPPDSIKPGSYYSNGEVATDWSVRQVVDESPSDDPERDMVVFKVVAGNGMPGSGVSTRTEFARWARDELVRDEASWKRIGD
jgi:hypothetical protein